MKEETLFKLLFCGFVAVIGLLFGVVLVMFIGGLLLWQDPVITLRDYRLLTLVPAVVLPCLLWRLDLD